MKTAVKEAKERAGWLVSHAKQTQREAAELRRAARQIPKEGRWVPFMIKREGIGRINRVVGKTLKENRHYVVKNARGDTGIHQWTKRGWCHVSGLQQGPFTHVWLPKRKKK